MNKNQNKKGRDKMSERMRKILQKFTYTVAFLAMGMSLSVIVQRQLDITPDSLTTYSTLVFMLCLMLHNSLGISREEKDAQKQKAMENYKQLVNTHGKARVKKFEQGAQLIVLAVFPIGGLLNAFFNTIVVCIIMILILLLGMGLHNYYRDPTPKDKIKFRNPFKSGNSSDKRMTHE